MWTDCQYCGQPSAHSSVISTENWVQRFSNGENRRDPTNTASHCLPRIDTMSGNTSFPSSRIRRFTSKSQHELQKVSTRNVRYEEYGANRRLIPPGVVVPTRYPVLLKRHQYHLQQSVKLDHKYSRVRRIQPPTVQDLCKNHDFQRPQVTVTPDTDGSHQMMLNHPIYQLIDERLTLLCA